MQRRKRRIFTEEFKAEAVRLVLTENQTVASVARDLDLTASSLRTWVNQAKIDQGQGPAGAQPSSPRRTREIRVHRSGEGKSSCAAIVPSHGCVQQRLLRMARSCTVPAPACRQAAKNARASPTCSKSWHPRQPRDPW